MTYLEHDFSLEFVMRVVVVMMVVMVFGREQPWHGIVFGSILWNG